MAALIPKGTGAGIGGVSAHSALTGLQGGAVGEYYHLTAAELAALNSLAAAPVYEPVLANGLGNLNVTYITPGTSLVPDFVLSSTGDIVMGIGAQNAT